MLVHARSVNPAQAGETLVEFDSEAELKARNEDLQRSNAQLVNRLTNIRVALAQIMATHWPEHVKGVENAMQGRLRLVPDSVLLSYLEAFSTMNVKGQTTSPNDLQEVRRALRDTGFNLTPTASAVDMATAIRSMHAAHKTEVANLKRSKDRAQGKTRNDVRDMENADWASAKHQPKTEEHVAGTARRTKGRTRVVEEIPLIPKEEETPDVLEPHTSRLVDNMIDGLRPVFLSDIVTLIGSSELAKEWEASQRSGGKVSFINPQARHSHRGALVIPSKDRRAGNLEQRKSTWGRALGKGYKGARLYDLAVVLRKLEDQILVCTMRTNAVELTYKSPQGVTGLVAALSKGADPWLDVEESVDSLMKTSGLTHIVVVCCPPRETDDMRQVLAGAWLGRSWKTDMYSVIVEPLQEWLTDTGRGGEAVTPAGGPSGAASRKER